MTDRMVRVDFTEAEARALLKAVRAAEEDGWVRSDGGETLDTYEQMQAAEQALRKLTLLTVA